jgi:hypothetical protein
MLALSAARPSAQVVVSEAGYVGPFTASSSDTSIAIVSRRVSNSTFTVTGVRSGNASITIADNAEHTSTFSVTVDGTASPSPSPSPTPKATSTPTITPNATPTATSTPTAPTTLLPTPIATPTSTPTATPTSTPGPLSVLPTSLTFNGTSQVQSVTITDPGAGTSFTVSGCSGIASLGTVSNHTFTVTSVAAGSCTVLLSDAFTHQATIHVGVTTLGVPIQ